MVMVKLLDESDLIEWDEFVLNHKYGTVYHTSWWKNVIERAYGHRPLYIIVRKKNGRIIGGLPTFLVQGKFTSNHITSVPCAQACDPLFYTQAEYEECLKYLQILVEKFQCKYAEIRTTSRFKMTTENHGMPSQGFSTYLLDLDRPLETIRKSFHKSHIQRAIKKSNKSGLQLLKSNTDTALHDFYRLYSIMRKEHGLLPQPFKFFVAMRDELRDRGAIDIYRARYDSNIISAMLILKFSRKVTYEYGASISGMLKLRPSHFLLWEAVRTAWSEGYKEFDFGRTSNDNIGLSQFKLRWGTQQDILTYCILYIQSEFKQMRDNEAAKKMMNFLVTHFPLKVSQIAGRLLYKHLV